MAPRKKKVEETLTPFDEPVTTNPDASELDDLFADKPELAGTDQRKPIDVDKPISIARSTKAPQLAQSTQPEKEPACNVSDDEVKSMLRSEEIAAELVRKNGRYIESVDNVQIGKRVDGTLNTHTVPAPIQFVNTEAAYLSEGVNTTRDDGKYILDTGAGAQSRDDLNEKSYNVHDPRSPDFMVCVNYNCQYRDNCLRYRMKNKRDNVGLLFPDQCRADGLYISLDDTDFTGYDSFESVDSSSAPNSLGSPE